MTLRSAIHYALIVPNDAQLSLLQALALALRNGKLQEAEGLVRGLAAVVEPGSELQTLTDAVREWLALRDGMGASASKAFQFGLADAVETRDHRPLVEAVRGAVEDDAAAAARLGALLSSTTALSRLTAGALEDQVARTQAPRPWGLLSAGGLVVLAVVARLLFRGAKVGLATAPPPSPVLKLSDAELNAARQSARQAMEDAEMKRLGRPNLVSLSKVPAALAAQRGWARAGTVVLAAELWVHFDHLRETDVLSLETAQGTLAPIDTFFVSSDGEERIHPSRFNAAHVVYVYNSTKAVDRGSPRWQVGKAGDPCDLSAFHFKLAPPERSDAVAFQEFVRPDGSRTAVLLVKHRALRHRLDEVLPSLVGRTSAGALVGFHTTTEASVLVGRTGSEEPPDDATVAYPFELPSDFLAQEMAVGSSKAPLPRTRLPADVRAMLRL